MTRNMNRAIGLKRQAELAIKDKRWDKAQDLIEDLESTVLTASSIDEGDIISDFVDDLWESLEAS
jgi:hypothetical protein